MIVFFLVRMMLLCLLVYIQLFTERAALLGSGLLAQFCVDDALCLGQQARLIMLAVGILQTLDESLPALSANGSTLCLHVGQSFSGDSCKLCIEIGSNALFSRR